MSDEKIQKIEVHLAEYNANLSTLAKDMAEIKGWVKPIQTHVIQVQTGLKIAKWMLGGGVISGLVAFAVKMAGT